MQTTPDKARERYGIAEFGQLTAVALCCQRELEQNPRKPEALVRLCLVALASHQVAPAVTMAQAAVAVAPRMCGAWVALGQAMKAAQRFEEAAGAYKNAIALDGTNLAAYLGMGELQAAAGYPEEAVAAFQWVLRHHPSRAAAHLGLGNALAMMGRNAEALERYDTVLALHPRLPEAEFAAGFALARMGRQKDAERRYRRVLAARPDFAAAWINLGCLLREQGRAAWAEAALRRALELRPDLITAWLSLALLQREQGCARKAETCLRRAFALDPAQVETLIGWCQFRAAEQDVAGAWGWLRWALAQDPAHDEAVNMHGILLHKQGRFAEAVEIFARAEALGNRAAASNRGNSLLDLGRMEEALHAQEAAVARDPESAGAQYNLALTQLRLGDWKRGWAGYEARWRFREVHRAPRVFAQPRWQGEELHGKRILLHAEQGLGDTIQFCRYTALVAARGGRPIVQVQPAAERLMRTLAVVRAGVADCVAFGAPLPPFDCECPLMSLPAVFATAVDTVPWYGAYLGAEIEEAAQRLARLPAAPGRRRVGIAWAGNPRYKADRARSMRLETWTPLLRAADVQWISLQKGEAAEQLKRLSGELAVFDGSSGDHDLAETAALLACLDLVITTDTCIAHLAGAMGKPVWILLPHLADWRWMQELETTPWYPTARLFRQAQPGDWPGILQRLAAEAKRIRII